MAEKIYKSTEVTLWKAYKFYGEVKCELSRNNNRNEYTVKVVGIRAHGSLWNFPVDYEIALYAKSSKTTVSINPKGTIPKSGSDTYSGPLPKSGWHSVNKAITITGNADGTCPLIQLYFKCYRNNVYYKSQKKYVNYSSVYSKTNISKDVQTQTKGPNDVTPPIIVIKPQIISPTSFKFTANVTNSIECSNWKYSIDGQQFKNFGSNKTTSATTTLGKVTSAMHTLAVSASKSSNAAIGGAASCIIDTRTPTIKCYGYTNSSTSGTISFSVDYDCGFTITNTYTNSIVSSGKITANTTKNVNVKLNNLDTQYKIDVYRTGTGNSVLKSSRYQDIYAELPSVSNFTMVPNNSTNTADILFDCPCKCYWEIIRPDGKRYSNNGHNRLSNVCNGTHHTIHSSIAINNVKGTYTLKVYRADATNSSGSLTLYSTATTVFDGRLPIIDTSSTKLTQVESCKGDLYISLDITQGAFPCSWTFGQKSGTISNSGNAAARGVVLDSDCIKNYSLRVYRTDTPVYSATYNFTNINTQGVSLEFVNVAICGDSVKFRARANQDCDVWRYRIKKGAVYFSNEVSYTDNNGTKIIEQTINNVPIETDFEIELKARRKSNKVVTTISSATCIAHGSARVYHKLSNESEPSWKNAVLYVAMKNSSGGCTWTPCTPCIYIDGEWKECI